MKKKKIIIKFIHLLVILLFPIIVIATCLILNNLTNPNYNVTLINNLTNEKVTYDKLELYKIKKQLKDKKCVKDTYGLSEWFSVTFVFYKGSKATSEYNTFRTGDYFVIKRPLLIIDAGHGGKDPGGGSNKYWLEKDLTLEISKYQYTRFLELKIPVMMTRTEDTTLSKNDRVDIINKSNAYFCISNHINAGGGDGAETIYSIHKTDKLPTLIANKIKDKGQNIRNIYTRKSTKNPNYDYYFINRCSKMESIIVEYGFADSKADDIEQLHNNWKSFAESVIEAFCIYTQNNYLPPSKK